MMLLLAAATLSCQREKTVSVYPSTDEITGPVFEASLALPTTRSHFNPADEGTDKAGTLYWDTDDQALIISVLQYDDEAGFSDRIDSYLEELSEGVVENYKTAYQDPAVGYMGAYIGKEVTKYMVTSLARVEIKEDKPTEAILHSSTTGTVWFANSDEAVGDALYEFLVAYPVQELHPLTLLYWENNMGCVGWPQDIAREQDGIHFGRYHICMDSGLDEDDPTGMYGLYPMNDVLYNGRTVKFKKVNPLTAMLRFRMKSNTPVDVAKLVITLEDENDFLTGMSWSSAWGEQCWIIPDRWTADNNYKDVVINFPTPVSVTATPSDYYYAVILPSFDVYSTGHDGNYYSPEAANQYSSVPIRFDAYNAADELVGTLTKTAPQYGFLPGGRYNVTLSLDGSTPDDHFDLIVNAGSYQNGGDPFIQE